MNTGSVTRASSANITHTLLKRRAARSKFPAPMAIEARMLKPLTKPDTSAKPRILVTEAAMPVADKILISSRLPA